MAESRLIGVDTETHAGVLWSVQVSIKEGTGLIVLASNKTVLQFLIDELNRLIKSGYILVFHNAAFDIAQLENVGLRVGNNYIDTQQCAYHFQNLPQGLKALSRRLLGRLRPGWKEVVGPPSRQALSSWLYDTIEKLEPKIEKRISEKTGKPLKDKLIKHPDHTDLNRILKHTLISDEYDPWKRLKLMERLDQASIPQLGIANCELSDAIHYGCSDADDTLTLALMFDRMRDEFHRSLNIQDEDIDR